ncbi:putative spermidine/putrescine transport system substrate-binding protein [Mycolicibacterium sp. BK556]|uniref:ABC transporter substrate-binding protein n=1 Tax=unclassified Mycolicibacterium TaxID=2636767 RepID=UPI00162163ED|nr:MULTISPECIES: ABC transporter substrate-binding protein [unclassified Mycolicibacterium]MBB3600929.1 putative spermidine/putrescine transport system substrate-binding protein [Mycolicibacterium sp. BK556]MBB3630683.1 putative spermidine/putrescine transport system substrate-binding protein [Mycolicibacterium sp. BK607]
MKNVRLLSALTAVVMVTAIACAPPEKKSGGDKTNTGVSAALATSSFDFGGMDGLIAAAKKEGELNVIALPPDWANYAAIIKAFSDKYGIKVNSAQPDASSQDEINAAVQQKGRSTAPDVFDLGQSVALANKSMFAPYKVATFDSIPDAMKAVDGLLVNDYGGYMSIGYDSAKVPDLSTVNDLMDPAYKGKVALNGDPTQAGAAFSGVAMVALSQGGSADDISAGVSFFERLKQAGNFLPVDPTPATIESGQTPVVIDWDYLNAAQTKKLPSWKVFVPQGAVLGGYYFQAINKDAPHPAAARLWQEFLYSDEGQNLYLQGGARPVRADAMVKSGTIDAAAYEKLPPVSGKPVILNQTQTDAATKYLADTWAKAVG